MTIQRKISVAAAVAVALAFGVTSFLSYQREVKNLMDQAISRAEAAVRYAEVATVNMEKKFDEGVFRDLKGFKKENGTWDEAKILEAVPIVTAMRMAKTAAENAGYTFKTPKFEPRIPTNEPDPTETEVIHKFQKNPSLAEHWMIDPELNAIRYFRPIRLSESCLMCHGDPKDSITYWDNDRGEDFSGAKMEGWKTGQIVGAFEVQQDLKQFQEVAKKSLRENLIVAASILLVGFLGIGYFMNTFNRFISSIGVKVNSSVQEILATTQDQEASARETVATTTEIGATAKEISMTSRELVNTMREVTEVAQQTAQFADNGQADLKRIEETMGRFTEAVKSMNTKLALINDKSSNINQVITTITKVADQTNLLSLNAAIEAEKAGEYGRGFAVVATEIRRLADQTAVATNDIEGIVKEMQSAVSSGVMGIEQFAEAVRRGTDEIKQIGYQLSEMLLQVRELFPRFERVNDGMQAQSTGAEQISEALVQLSEASRNVLDSLQRSKVSSQQLDQVWEKLRDGISRFTGSSGKQS